MSDFRNILSTKIWNRHALPTILLIGVFLGIGSSTFAQRRERGAAAVPQTTFREPHRSADAYDRDLDRMKVARMVSAARERKLLSQINEDFARIQVIHNEVVVVTRGADKLKYELLVALGTEMKKRSKRLRSNLALPATPDSKENLQVVAPTNDSDLHEPVIKLHEAVVSFVTNPMFSQLGLLEVTAVQRASSDLKQIIFLSDRIKSFAEQLSRLAEK